MQNIYTSNLPHFIFQSTLACSEKLCWYHFSEVTLSTIYITHIRNEMWLLHSAPCPILDDLKLHSTKKPVTTMLTYPWKCTVLHCNHLGNTWKPLVLMIRHFDYCPSASKGDNQSVRSSAPVVSRCFPGGYNVKLYISRGRLAWWLLAFLHSVNYVRNRCGGIRTNRRIVRYLVVLPCLSREMNTLDLF